VSEVAARHGATARAVISGEAFLTPPGVFGAGRRGDPRRNRRGAGNFHQRRHVGCAFPESLCPVIEFGLCNATMHKRDEAVAVADLEALERIFARIAVRG
jgi:succinyl-diaminopimelate desuccinylase